MRFVERAFGVDFSVNVMSSAKGLVYSLVAPERVAQPHHQRPPRILGQLGILRCPEGCRVSLLLLPRARADALTAADSASSGTCGHGGAVRRSLADARLEARPRCDRTGTPEQPGDPLVGEFLWTRQSNQYGWRSYLGDSPAEAPQVPVRLEDFAGLPPTWMATAALDLFRDENIEYAHKLMQAGVRTELISYPAACHGFPMVPGTHFAARYAKDHLRALARGLGVPLVP